MNDVLHSLLFWSWYALKELLTILILVTFTCKSLETYLTQQRAFLCRSFIWLEAITIIRTVLTWTCWMHIFTNTLPPEDKNLNHFFIRKGNRINNLGYINKYHFGSQNFRSCRSVCSRGPDLVLLMLI